MRTRSVSKGLGHNRHLERHGVGGKKFSVWTGFLCTLYGLRTHTFLRAFRRLTGKINERTEKNRIELDGHIIHMKSVHRSGSENKNRSTIF